MTRRVRGLLVPLVALLVAVTSGGWLVTQLRSDTWAGAGGERLASTGLHGTGGPWATGDGAMRGGAMMGGYGWLEGEGRPVRGLPDARERVERFAESLGQGLLVGEVMRFTNHYYAELEDADGAPATEVLVDPRTGAVGLEHGPARMWNTRYGMMAAGPGSRDELTPEQARTAAARWLRVRGELTAGQPEAFPGYYTMHTLRNGEIAGMLSVHAVTGAVWYHGWHGRFLAMSEHA